MIFFSIIMYYIILTFFTIYNIIELQNKVLRGGLLMNIPQFHTAEFERLLERVISGQDNFYHCSAATVSIIKDILYTDYPEREDDLEFLMDMVNYQMRSSGYTGRKPRFPVSRHLDRLCAEPLYINTYRKRKA